MHQFTETASFVTTSMKKYIKQFILPVGSFFFEFLDRKVVGLMPKYSLLPGDTNQDPFFSLNKIKMS